MKLVQSLAASVVAGLVVLMASCNGARADDLPTFVTSELEALEKKRQEALTVARKPLTDLKEKYVEALKRTGDAARAAGNHTKVEVFENEMKRLKSGAGHDNPMNDSDPVLDVLRNTYTEHHAKRQAEVLGMGGQGRAKPCRCACGNCGGTEAGRNGRGGEACIRARTGRP